MSHSGSDSQSSSAVSHHSSGDARGGVGAHHSHSSSLSEAPRPAGEPQTAWAGQEESPGVTRQNLTPESSPKAARPRAPGIEASVLQTTGSNPVIAPSTSKPASADLEQTNPVLAASMKQNNNHNTFQSEQTREWNHPHSRLRRYWNGLVFAGIVYNTITVPLRFSFFANNHVDAGFLAIDYIFDLIFLADSIWYGTVLGYLYQGELRLARADIFQHYAKTMLIPDVISLVPVDIAFTSTPILNGLLRLNRLLRLLRTFEYFQWWEYNTHYANLVRLAKLLLGMAVMAHWVGCIYFTIQVYENSLPNYHDVTQWGLGLLGGDGNVSLGDQYTNSLLWAFTLMTSLGPQINAPSTLLEAIFMIVAIVFGLLMFGAIVGQVSSLIAEMNQEELRFRERMDEINSWMKNRGLPMEITYRIRSYYEYLYSKDRGIRDNEILNEFPLHLRKDVALKMHRDLIDKVKFFAQTPDAFIEQLVLKLQLEVYAPKDHIIRAGELGSCMYFISRGEVDVILEDGTYINTLKAGSFFGEIAVLAHTRRTASCIAHTYVDCYVLTKRDVDKALIDYPEAATYIQAVAENRLKRDQTRATQGGASTGKKLQRRNSIATHELLANAAEKRKEAVAGLAKRLSTAVPEPTAGDARSSPMIPRIVSPRDANNNSPSPEPTTESSNNTAAPLTLIREESAGSLPDANDTRPTSAASLDDRSRPVSVEPKTPPFPPLPRQQQLPPVPTLTVRAPSPVAPLPAPVGKAPKSIPALIPPKRTQSRGAGTLPSASALLGEQAEGVDRMPPAATQGRNLAENAVLEGSATDMPTELFSLNRGSTGKLREEPWYMALLHLDTATPESLSIYTPGELTELFSLLNRTLPKAFIAASRIHEPPPERRLSRDESFGDGAVSDSEDVTPPVPVPGSAGARSSDYPAMLAGFMDPDTVLRGVAPDGGDSSFYL